MLDSNVRFCFNKKDVKPKTNFFCLLGFLCSSSYRMTNTILSKLEYEILDFAYRLYIPNRFKPKLCKD